MRNDNEIVVDLGLTGNNKMYAVAETKQIRGRLMSWMLIGADTMHPMHHPDMPAIFPLLAIEIPHALNPGMFPQSMPIAEHPAALSLAAADNLQTANALTSYVELLREKAGKGRIWLEYPKSMETLEALRLKKRSTEGTRKRIYDQRRNLALALFRLSNFQRRLRPMEIKDPRTELEILIATFYNFARACGLRDARDAMAEYVGMLNKEGIPILEEVFNIRESHVWDALMKDEQLKVRKDSILQNVLVRIKRTSYFNTGTVLLPNDFWSSPNFHRSDDFQYPDS